MRNFWAYVTNGEYSVGCTGRTVFIYDKDDNEIAKFKDITYGYTPMFSPDGKIVVIKTPEGRFAVYSLETLSLIKKFRFSKVDGAQDDGFCFSHDSKYLINLERHQDSLHSAVSIYDTSDFSLVNRVFIDETIMLSTIEYDEQSDMYFVLGFERGTEGYASKFFVARLVDLQIMNITYIPQEEKEFYRRYKDLEVMGFTKKKYQWSFFDCSLEELKSMKCSLAELYKRYNL